MEFEWFKGAIWDEGGVTGGADMRLTNGAMESCHGNGVIGLLELVLAGTEGKVTTSRACFLFRNLLFYGS